MKHKSIVLLLTTLLLSVNVFAAEITQPEESNIPAETRIVTIEADSEAADAEPIEITETQYLDASGLSLWYNAENLKPAEYGGQLSFIPVAEEEALKSPVVLIVVPNEPGETPSPLNEVTAGYPAENVEEIEENALESGMTIQSVQAIDGTQLFKFYIAAYEDVSINITAWLPAEEVETYMEEFDRIVESITIEETE